MATAMPGDLDSTAVALVAMTATGVQLALRIRDRLPAAEVYVPVRHRFALAYGAHGFSRLKQVFPELWGRYRKIVCIMATGIVVRLSAPLIAGKREDPAVVVVDERGRFVISLLSGHLGGANRLARQVAAVVGGEAVITTASDVEGRPALDLIARDLGLTPENPALLARLERAVLEDEPIRVVDPYQLLRPALSGLEQVLWLDPPPMESGPCCEPAEPVAAGIWVSERAAPTSGDWLLLRPANLVVGVGCNRGTEAAEILQLIIQVLNTQGFSPLSIRNLASIDLKADESGLLEAAEKLQVPIEFFPREAIATVAVPNPSATVAIHAGVPSVCEATALVSARGPNLLIPKHKSRNATVAVALADWTSSASAPAPATI